MVSLERPATPTHVPDLVSHGGARAGSAIYGPFPARRVPSPTPKRREGAGLPCPDSAGYNPACPSLVPKGRAQDGNQNTPVGLGLSHI